MDCKDEVEDMKGLRLKRSKYLKPKQAGKNAKNFQAQARGNPKLNRLKVPFCFESSLHVTISYRKALIKCAC